mmetsp:Transcript_19243/g.37738  ORF Transcript_19243/g.37738 Transcript_19243/m.37738 type:complete len:200 (+) Transcript_19243:2032-2631(+)
MMLRKLRTTSGRTFPMTLCMVRVPLRNKLAMLQLASTRTGSEGSARSCNIPSATARSTSSLDHGNLTLIILETHRTAAKRTNGNGLLRSGMIASPMNFSRGKDSSFLSTCVRHSTARKAAAFSMASSKLFGSARWRWTMLLMTSIVNGSTYLLRMRHMASRVVIASSLRLIPRMFIVRSKRLRSATRVCGSVSQSSSSP